VEVKFFSCPGVNVLLPVEEPNGKVIYKVFTKTMGSATADTEVVIEFQINQSNLGFKTEKLPFQLHVIFTRPDGSKSLRVVTKCLPLTYNKQLAESTGNFDVLAIHVLQKSGRLARFGHYRDCITLISEVKGFLGRVVGNNPDELTSTKFSKVIRRSTELLDGVRRERKKEQNNEYDTRREYVSRRSRDRSKSRSRSRSPTYRKMRVTNRDRDDRFAGVIWKANNFSMETLKDRSSSPPLRERNSRTPSPEHRGRSQRYVRKRSESPTYSRSPVRKRSRGRNVERYPNKRRRISRS